MADSPTHNPPPQPAASSSATISSPRSTRSPVTSRKHPRYRGIRSRSGKWVSEIRQPRKTTRIWLGTYPTPEMAAAAYDVAAIALKGPGYSVPLNFPEMASFYPIPLSTSATDIRAAALTAAALKQPTLGPEGNHGAHAAAVDWQEIMEEGEKEGDGTFVDEEELLNMPNLLVDMAEAMMVSPPRIINNSPPSDDLPGNSDAEAFWNYP